MAHIHPHGDQWRAQVSKHGVRKSKVLPTEALAKEWAAETEKMNRRRTIQALTMPDRVKLAATALATSIPRRLLEANALVPYKHDEIVAAAIPGRIASGIYFLIRGDEVVYIGQSVDMLHRIARHRREGRTFDGYATLECDEADMDRLETLYITAFMPYLNSTLGNATATEAFSSE